MFLGSFKHELPSSQILWRSVGSASVVAGVGRSLVSWATVSQPMRAIVNYGVDRLLANYRSILTKLTTAPAGNTPTGGGSNPILLIVAVF